MILFPNISRTSALRIYIYPLDSELFSRKRMFPVIDYADKLAALDKLGTE